MNVKCKLLIISLLFSAFSFAQMQDLEKLASGKLVFSTTLVDSDESLYGYFYIYEIDNKDKKTLNYEYVVLDKNLNKINNGFFDGPKSKFMIEPHFNDCTLMGDILILDKLYLYYDNGIPNIYLNTIQTISLKDNSVSKEKEFKDNAFIDLDVTRLKALKLYTAKKRFFITAFSNSITSGLFVSDVNNDKEVVFFDSTMQRSWSYKYNDKDTLNNKHFDFKLKLLKNKIIYATERCNNKLLKKTYFNIVAIDCTTGKKLYEYQLDSDKDSIYHTYEFQEINSHLVVTGRYNTNVGHLDFRNYYKGLYKIVLDEEGKEIEKVYHPWSDFSSQIKLNKKGRVKHDYRLNEKKTFVFDNGSISILTEMYKPQRNSFWLVPIINWFTERPSETKDFIIFNFDKSFNLSRVDTIAKDRTKNNGSDYIFSQKIKDNSGVVFFNTNNKKDLKTRKKNLMLGINSIVDGKLTQELIPIAQKKKYLILPMPAKEGYVMLREYNEKDKYNQIRLEKLNY
jgi:hypothetical protein